MRRFRTLLVAAGLLCSGYAAQATVYLHIQVPAELHRDSTVRWALADTRQLLEQAGVVFIEKAQAYVILDVLPLENRPRAYAEATPYPLLAVPNERFGWNAFESQGKYRFTLKAYSPKGVANGLYGLLQEHLGFRFLHPRQTLVPRIESWPLRKDFQWSARPRFDKRGFHLHTQHPLELTEQLMDPDFPNALADVKAYIDWLARNGQNVFQYYLLRRLKWPEWVAHNKAITDYAHQRGILCGLKTSFHSIQQYAHQLMGKGWLKGRAKRQIEKRLVEHLFAAGYDYIAPDISKAEFFGGVGKKSVELERHAIAVCQREGKKFFYVTHVVDDHAVGFKKGQADSLARALNPHLPAPTRAGPASDSVGCLVHSVMFYTLTEPYAPTYGNDNLRFMWQEGLKHQQTHETWHFPESAYWITFDINVPQLLLPYLSARLADIDSCAARGFAGHVTFSSGWEWGYWLVDWSIARWSWESRLNGQVQPHSPTEYFDELFPQPRLQAAFRASLQLQEDYLKAQNLMRFMAAPTVTDELSDKFRKPFAPQPKLRYKEIWTEAGPAELQALQLRGVDLLEKFAQQQRRLAEPLYRRPGEQHGLGMLQRELYQGLLLTGLRAQHRALTLQQLLDDRRARIKLDARDPHQGLLQAADSLRAVAQAHVDERRTLARYAPEQLYAQRRKSVTSYPYGYLRHADDLWFWQREAAQVRRKKFSPLFMNSWPILRIAGLWYAGKAK